MNAILKNQRNCSIDICRYLFAILVVANHCALFTDIYPLLGFATTQVVCRPSVMFFLCVAGYYYFGKLEEGKKAFFPYFSRLLATYAVWSALYYIGPFFSWGYENIRGFFGYVLLSFFFTGSCYHFWFFPAILFSVLAGTVLFRPGLRKLLLPLSIGVFCLGAACCTYGNIAGNVPAIASICEHPYFSQIRHIVFTGFPFFCSGYAVRQMRRSFYQFKSNSLLCLLLSVVVWLAEILIVTHFRLYRTLAITPGMYLLTVTLLNFLLEHPMPTAVKAASLCKVLANFTYYSHVLLMNLITLFIEKIFHVESVSTPILFLLTVSAAFLFGRVIWKRDSQILNFLVR